MQIMQTYNKRQQQQKYIEKKYIIELKKSAICWQIFIDISDGAKNYFKNLVCFLYTGVLKLFLIT